MNHFHTNDQMKFWICSLDINPNMEGIILRLLLLFVFNVHFNKGLEFNALLDDYSPVTCPDGWDPSPCGCYEQSSATSVICKNISSEKELANVFASLLKPTAFTDFILRGSKIETLPSGVFGFARFMGFEFIDTTLKNVENGAFKGSEETATGVAFLKNQVENFDFECLRSLKNLVMFTMSSENIESIPNNAFANSSKLAVINIVRSRISTIGSRAFANLTNIHHIVIMGNQVDLTKVDDYAFYNPTAQYFERLVLSSNNLSDSTLSPKALHGVNSTYVDLQENRFTTLPEEVFDPLLNTMAGNPNGLIMGFGNPIQCDEKIRWLINKPMKVKGLLMGFECPDKKYVTELKEDDIET